MIPGSGGSSGEGKGYPLHCSQASLAAQLVKNPPARQEAWFDSWVRRVPWRRDGLPSPLFSGFPGGSAGEKSTCDAGDPGHYLGWEDSLEEGIGSPLQYSCLENSIDRGACTGVGDVKIRCASCFSAFLCTTAVAVIFTEVIELFLFISFITDCSSLA